MNKLEMKEWRSLQIAVTMLYRFCGDIHIESVENIFYDLKVRITKSNLCFGVKVGSSSFVKTVSYKTYIDKLRKSYNRDNTNFIPIILMCVNETAESATWGFQVGWWYNRPIILNQIRLLTVNDKSWALLYDHIKSMDSTIRLLSSVGMKIIKELHIKVDSSRRTYGAKIIYLRDFSDKYKMKEASSATNEERFYRMIYGIPQEEYPNDKLDDIIYEAVDSEYPISSVHSRLLLLTSELRDLQKYHDIRSEKGTILIEPKISLCRSSLFNKIEVPKIIFDIYPDTSFEIEFFKNVSISYSLSDEEWLKCYNEITAAIKTIHSIDEFLQ